MHIQSNDITAATSTILWLSNSTLLTTDTYFLFRFFPTEVKFLFPEIPHSQKTKSLQSIHILI